MTSWLPPSPQLSEPVPDEPPPPAPEVQFAWWSPFAALATAVLCSIIAVVIIAGIAGVEAGEADDLPAGVTLAATYVQDFLLVGAMLMFASITGAALTPAAFGLRRIPLKRGALWAGGGFLAFYAFLFLWSLILDVDEEDDLAQELGADETAIALVAVTLLVTVIAPIAEELFFRGFMFSAIRSRLGWVFAGIITGVVFGLVHAGGTPAVFLVPLAALGFLLCALYQRTGSLLPGMAVHAFNNALALGVTLDWEAWQTLLALALAPTVVVTIAGRVARR